MVRTDIAVRAFGHHTYGAGDGGALTPVTGSSVECGTNPVLFAHKPVGAAYPLYPAKTRDRASWGRLLGRVHGRVGGMPNAICDNDRTTQFTDAWAASVVITETGQIVLSPGVDRQIRCSPWTRRSPYGGRPGETGPPPRSGPYCSTDADLGRIRLCTAGLHQDERGRNVRFMTH
jgi:hypothetical protein